MSRVLLTGGTGFVGANLVRRLVERGDEVHLPVRATSDLWRLRDLAADLRLHEVDLRDAAAVQAALAAVRPECVYHLAVYGAYPYQTDLREMVQSNLVATINVVEAALAAGCERLVNTGSSSEYGFKDHAPAEAELPEPNSSYALTKVSATLYCQHIARSRAVHVPTLRLYSVYGPYEEPTRLIPALVLQGLKGGLPPLVRPDIARDYVYVDDVVDAYLLAAKRPGSEPGAVYNVGTGVQTSLGQAVGVARRVLDVGQEPQWGSLDARVWDTSVWVADNRRIRQELGWQPAYDFEAGFRRTADWFRSHPDMQAFYRERQVAASR